MADLMSTAQILTELIANQLEKAGILKDKNAIPAVCGVTEMVVKCGQISNTLSDVTDPSFTRDELEATLQHLEEAGKQKALADIMRQYTVSKGVHETQKKVLDELEAALKLAKLAVQRDSRTVLSDVTEAAISGKSILQAIKDKKIQDIFTLQSKKLNGLAKDVDKLEKANVNLKTQFGKQLSQAVQELTATPGQSAATKATPK